jgi:hypothetical protein
VQARASKAAAPIVTAIPTQSRETTIRSQITAIAARLRARSFWTIAVGTQRRIKPLDEIDSPSSLNATPSGYTTRPSRITTVLEPLVAVNRGPHHEQTYAQETETNMLFNLKGC